MAAPTILSVYPADESLGIPIGGGIVVTFDQEMDEESINTGTFVVIAPDTINTFGPGLEPVEQQALSDQDVLSTASYEGFVPGTITFTRVDENGDPVDDSEVDYDGDGTLWRTVATFTPAVPLSPNTEYTVIVSGDDDQTDSFDAGVKTRTVFDAQATAVTGTGSVTGYGVYTGSTTREYTIEIDGAGATGVATYLWYNSATPLEVTSGITTTGYRTLEDGLRIAFGADGAFVVGDTWTITVVPYELMANNYSWSFNTGDGSIITPTSTYSASGITEIGATTEATAFAVSAVSPASGAYGVEISTDTYVGEQVVFTFSGSYDIDSDTITDDNITVELVSPITGLATPVDLEATATVSGQTLTIELTPGQLTTNNIVSVTLDSSIANEYGTTLGEDYTAYFATTYSPLYTDIRRIMLDIGPIISSLTEETIYLAILTASLEADAITFASSTINVTYRDFARREYTSCLAELYLIGGVGAGGSADRFAKQLGDLSISRQGGGIAALQRDKQACIEYWRQVVQSNGNTSADTSLEPGWMVKGALADDAITVHREWEPISRPGAYRAAANTTRYRNDSSNRHRYKTYRGRFNRGGN